MRSLSALLGLAGLATVVGNERLIDTMQFRAAPNRTDECPVFFNTDPDFNTIVGSENFGSLLDSVSYSVTFPKMRWGRKTWIQLRFYSNVQDLPFENVKFCIMPYSNTPDDDKYAPEFQNRVKYAPRIRGPQPLIELNSNVSLPYVNATGSGQGFDTVCVTVPSVKAKGIQKVNFQYASDRCTTELVWKGWVEFDNPFYSLYPTTAPQRCFANQNPSGPDNFNPVETYGAQNLKVPKSCGTCTPGVNCKGDNKVREPKAKKNKTT
ncbi:Hypothetical protein NocV09_08700080 [Nannochloropsis oceanica]